MRHFLQGCWVAVALLLIPPLSAAQSAAAASTPAAQNATEAIEKALDHMHNLEYDQAIRELKTITAGYPNDLRAQSSLATAILHREMYAKGVFKIDMYTKGGSIFSGNKPALDAEFEKEFLSASNRAIALADARLKANPNDEEALYWGGDAHAQVATYEFTLRRAYLASLREGGVAYAMHSRLYKMDPHATDALLVIGLHNYIVGSLPFYIKMLAALAGHHGSKQQGVKMLQEVSSHGEWARAEAQLILAVFYGRDRQYLPMIDLLRGLYAAYPGNFLLPIEMAGAYEKLGLFQNATQVLDTLLANHDLHRSSFPPFPAAQLYYRAGQDYLKLGDKAAALERFVRGGALPGKDIHIFRADLAAARIYQETHQTSRALAKYRVVADSVPQTEEGRLAQHAIDDLRVGRKGKMGEAG